MLRTIEGVYRNGKVELAEVPSDVREEMRVLVTFLEPQHIDVRVRGIDIFAAPQAAAPLKHESHSAELRARLGTFAEDWDSREMAIYDDYDAAKARLQTQ